MVNKVIKSAYLLVVSLMSTVLTNGQISNSSFEINTGCPTGINQVYLATGWNTPTLGTPDYFNICGWSSFDVPSNYFGNENAYTGNSYVGMVLKNSGSATFEWREYIQTQLMSPLIPGLQYELTMHVNLAEYSQYGSDDIGALFSTTPVARNDNNRFTQIPQAENPTNNFITNTNGWTLLSMSFIADSAYQFVTIGNFKNDANTSIVPAGNGNSESSYIYIDEISLFISDSSLQILGDTSICINDSTTLTAMFDTSYLWAESSNPGTIISQDSFLVVSPSVTTSYLLYGSQDTVSITVSVFDPPVLNLGFDTMFCGNELILLDAYLQDASYIWQDNSTNSIYAVTFPGTYWVNVYINACILSDTIDFSAEECSILLDMPDVFTPNNDGINDLFIPVYKEGIFSVHTYIYNRWGNLIFETQNLNIEWNGDNAVEGAYYWIVNYKNFGGLTYQSSGIVTLLR